MIEDAPTTAALYVPTAAAVSQRARGSILGDILMLINYAQPQTYNYNSHNSLRLYVQLH